jgi:hypothetical protein
MLRGANGHCYKAAVSCTHQDLSIYVISSAKIFHGERCGRFEAAELFVPQTSVVCSLTTEVPMRVLEWLRKKDSNLHFRVQSPTCCLLHHCATNFGALGFEPRTLRQSGANTVYKTAALPLELYPDRLVAVEGIEPTSLDYQSSALG